MVNIFTRLNTAGRALTREDITFAWLKIGWDVEASENKNAKACIDALAHELYDLNLPLNTEDVISAISFIWAVAFNGGKLLTNNDLIRGDAIRPMAANVSTNWSRVVDAITKISMHARDRGLRFREHYQSVNALSYLWAWCFIALSWSGGRNLRERDNDAFEKRLIELLDKYMDRWLICSQWAGVWASSNAVNVAKYASGLAACAQKLEETADVATAAAALANLIENDLKAIEQDAISNLSAMTVDDRQHVRAYYTALWIWNRLDKDRWNAAKLALRQKRRRKTSLEVDHIVAWDLWNTKLAMPLDLGPDFDAKAIESYIEESRPKINDLGNCMLLEKNFNISKSNSPLKSFLDGVYEFKEKKIELMDWAAALDLGMAQVDCGATSIEDLLKLFAARSEKIRGDLEGFVRGIIGRIDLDVG